MKSLRTIVLTAALAHAYWVKIEDQPLLLKDSISTGSDMKTYYGMHLDFLKTIGDKS